MIEVFFYLIGIALVCVGGYYKKSLTLSGSIAAFIVGCCIVLGLEWKGLILLGAFFVSSNHWSKYKKQRKEKLDDILAKGARRDWLQVMANGAFASAASLLFYFTGDNLWQTAVIISIAAANSDTWASEIGVLSKHRPIYILSFKRVERGTSGAVSLLGLLSSLGGSALIVVLAAVLLPDYSLAAVVLMIGCGLAGSLIDTVIGAVVQVKYKCLRCGIITEKLTHCGQPATVVKGVRFINNDAVNFLSIAAAALLGMLLSSIFR